MFFLRKKTPPNFLSHQVKNRLNSSKNKNQIFSNEVGAKLLSFNSREKVPSKCSSHQFLSSLDKINQKISSKVGANFQSCYFFQKKKSSKVFFLSYRKQFEHFGEHQSIFFSNLRSKI